MHANDGRGGGSGMRAWRALVVAGASALVLAACGGGGAAPPAGGTQAAGEHWQVVRPASQAWQAVAESNGTFVAVGAPGGIVQSTDGLNWTHHDTQRGFGWGNVVHGDAGWLILSWDGHVATSPDGVAWTLQSQALASSNGKAVTVGLAFGNGVFVVVGPTGNFSSVNGSDWSPTSGAFSFVQFGDGVFVAGISNVDGPGNDPLYVSADGRTWAAAAGTEGFSVGGLAFGNGRFMALDANGQTRTSPDGTHWTLQPPSAFPTGVPSRLAFAAGSFYAFLPGLYASTDGASWAPMPAPPGNTDSYWLGGIAGNANGLAGISASGALYGGSDAQHLSQRVAPSGGDFVAVDHRDGLFDALSNTFDPVALTSTDGRSWTATPMFPHPWNDREAPQALAHAPDGTFVATGWGEDPVIPSGDHVGAAWSADGVTWTEVGAFPGLPAWGKGIVHDGTRFVLVDELGRLAAKPSGRADWTTLGTIPLQRGQSVEGMAFGGGRYVVVGTLGLAATSQDGVHWTVAPPLGQTAEVAMHAVAWNGREFVAVGASGLVATSPDGVAWQVSPSATPTELWGVAVSAAGECVAVGWYGVAESSSDCAHWTVRTPQAWAPLFGVAAFEGGFVAVGTDGQVELSQ